MRVPYEWLHEFVDPGIAAKELAERLTLSGIEVGAVETFKPPLPEVLVGLVEQVRPHPVRGNLTVVNVNVGSEPLEIVCGAKNVRGGDKVPVALPGAMLPGKRKIDAVDFYGVTSRGMLCSARELDLDLGEEDEILILEPGTPIGERIDQVLGFGEEVLELELTPNRADCLSMIGFAHEVAALTGNQVKLLFPEPAEEGPQIDELVSVHIEEQNLCPRYSARAVLGVNIGPSPLWMQMRLLKAGIRPIYNVVDVTNYVMWESGQPLHAFDLERLGDKKIIVRRARQGERLITLDGIKRQLQPEDLVIADSTKAVGLGGVMGGENTEITGRSQMVLIEAAEFDPANIRRTARRYNLPSEASQRFEKGVNPEAVLWSQNRASDLIQRLAGGQVAKGVLDLRLAFRDPARILLDPKRINRILGLEVPQREMEKILDQLGFSIEKPDHRGCFAVNIPLRRPDVQLEEDIAEEVARLYGYDRIPAVLPGEELPEKKDTGNERLQPLVRDILIACGYFECITYSFINPALLARLRLNRDDRRLAAIPVCNPFSEEQGVMRTTLLPGLLKTVQYNCSHRILNQQLFEIGAVFEANSLPLSDLPEEKPHLALGVTGLVPGPNWVTPSSEADFFTIKGALEAIFERLQIEAVDYIPHSFPFGHPTRGARVQLEGRELGYIAQVHPDVAAEWDIDQAVTVCEIDLSLLDEAGNLVPRATPLPRYPSAKRDLAFIVSAGVSARQLENAIREAGGAIVREVELFDLYTGPQIPAGKRSLAYALTFRLDDGTLTDAEINRAMINIENKLLELGAELRR